jgi:hypothetical protein
MSDLAKMAEELVESRNLANKLERKAEAKFARLPEPGTSQYDYLLCKAETSREVAKDARAASIVLGNAFARLMRPS